MKSHPKDENAPATKNRSYIVSVREWREHVAIIEAVSAEEAKSLGAKMWNDDPRSDAFTVEDGGLITITVEE